MTTTTDRSALVAGYRRAADLIEQHPDLVAPIVLSGGKLYWSLYAFECPDGVPAMIAAIRRAVGGKWDKRETRSVIGTDGLVFSRDGYGIEVQRETVCTRRVVDTWTEIVPAVEAQPERAVEREVVEWDCHPIIADQPEVELREVAS